MKTNRIIWLAVALLPCTGLCGTDVYNFENDAVKETDGVKQSRDFVFTLTGEGDSDNLAWEIKQDSSAPSGKNVMAILKADAVDAGFPVALLKGKKYQDVDLSVRFKIIGGKVNQAGGLMFRAVDVDHSYLVRASAIDNTVVLMRINKRQQTRVASAKVNVGVNHWNSIRVVVKGTDFECYLNDNKVFTARDDVYPLGKVGMVSQADAQIYFDDFTVSTP